MTVPFPEVCSQTVARRGVAVHSVVDSGAQNCVVIADGGTLIFRFPRYRPDRIGEVADRHRRARDLGLPAPAVIDIRPGRVGAAHVVLEHVPGTPLQDLLPEMAPAARRAAATGIADLLLQLRGITAPDWPFPAPGWNELWSGFAARARAATADPASGVSAADADLAQAASRTAASAPSGLVHGDLAWGNILFDDLGNVQAILDWDFAVVGDPAIDVAAVLMNITPDMVLAFHQHHRHTAADLARFDAYLATWDLQHRMGIHPGDA